MNIPLLPILILMFACGAYGQELDNPNKLKLCPKDQTARYDKCWGTYKHQNGEKYVGEFKADEYHGYGIYTGNNGSKYVGEYKDNKRHGQGTLTYANGDKYVGEFKEGKIQGLGTYYYLAENQFKGDKYFGELKDGKAHGKGTYIGANGDKYVGEFKEDKIHGQGTYTFANGDKYVGEHSNAKINGSGTFTFADGAVHMGEYKEHKRHGQGIFTEVDGTRKEGIWENDKFVRKAKTNLHLPDNNAAATADKSFIDLEKKQLAEERRKLEIERNQHLENQGDESLNRKGAVADSRRRLALVIGNASYKNAPLRNPTNDADLITKTLTASGFLVSRHDNLTYAKMREVVRNFGEKLSKGDVGLFYYSGHAVQYRGKNYLLPVNEDLKHSDEIPSSAMDIDFVLAKMESAKNDLNIVVLDACRNNPLGAETRSIERGLTSVNAAKGTFIAFSTSPGNVALDGAGSNSPYTKNLAQAIRKGGMTLEQVFKEVRRNVISETNSQQVPWENSSILGDFYFR